MSQYKCHARYDAISNNYAVIITNKTSDKTFIGKPIEFEEVGEGSMLHEPTLLIPSEQAVNFFTCLIKTARDAGLFINEPVERELLAQGEHLKDMQNLTERLVEYILRDSK